ncbi:MAG: hypothetical protein AAF802_01330 [Planctomycetota bacterium]
MNRYPKRLWEDEIEELRRFCEVALITAGRDVCDGNMAELIRSTRRLRFDEHDEQLLIHKCLANPCVSDQFLDLHFECRQYFDRRFRAQLPIVREAITRTLLEQIEPESAALSL